MNSRHIAALVFLASFWSAGAYAQGHDAPSRWYVGLDYGESQLDSDTSAGAIERDDSSDTFALRVGYRFTRYFALEAGYTDIGDFSATFSPSCGSGTCPLYHSKSSIDGVLLNSLFTWPLAEHFQLKGALGMTYRELDASMTTANSTSRWSDTETIFTFGAGIGIPISDRFEIDLDYTHYREIGLGMSMNSSVGVIDNAESSQVTLGARFRF